LIQEFEISSNNGEKLLIFIFPNANLVELLGIGTCGNGRNFPISSLIAKNLSPMSPASEIGAS